MRPWAQAHASMSSSTLAQLKHATTIMSTTTFVWDHARSFSMAVTRGSGLWRCSGMHCGAACCGSTAERHALSPNTIVNASPRTAALEVSGVGCWWGGGHRRTDRRAERRWRTGGACGVLSRMPTIGYSTVDICTDFFSCRILYGPQTSEMHAVSESWCILTLYRILMLPCLSWHTAFFGSKKNHSTKIQTQSVLRRPKDNYSHELVQTVCLCPKFQAQGSASYNTWGICTWWLAHVRNGTKKDWGYAL